MREVKQNSYLDEIFFMADSSDLVTGITSLGFANSGDLQIYKPGAGFADITSACAVTEQGFGFYRLVSSDSAHMDTLGRNVIHASATSSLSAVPAEIMLDNVETRSNDVYISVSSVQADVGSYDQYKADLTALLAGVGQGTIYVPTASVDSGTPMQAHVNANFDPIIYVSQAWSGFVNSGYPVWLTGKLNDFDGTALFSVQGTVTNTQSMSAVFSLDPSSHMNHEPTNLAHYEVQFRNSGGTVVKVAQTGGLRLLPTLKT